MTAGINPFAQPHAPNPAGGPGPTGSNPQDHSGDFDAAAWARMVGLSQSQKHDLAQPAEAAQELVNNWNKWGFNKSRSFNPLPSDSPEEKRVLGILNKAPVMKAISADHSGNAGNANQSKGQIDQFEVSDFASAEAKEAKKASGDYNAWLKKNPKASEAAKTLAQSDAFIEGNMTLLSAGDPSSKSLVKGVVSETDLQDITKSGGLSKTLNGAAQLWQNPGLFSVLDTAGADKLATSPDGLFDETNTSAFLQNDVFTADDTVQAFMQSAALTQSTAGIDTSKISPDIFKQDSHGNYVNLGKYSGAQKAAVLAQLNQVQQVIKLYQADKAKLASDNSPTGVHGIENQPSTTLGILNIAQLRKDGINPNLPDTLKQIQGHIAALQADSSEQQYQAKHVDLALQNMTSSDPAFARVMKKSLDAFQSGATLKADLHAKDKKGNPVSTADAVNNFVTQGAFYQAAFGSGSKPDKQINLNQIAHKSGEYGKILKYYQDNIVSGKAFGDNIKQLGNHLGLGANAFADQVQSFSATLDPADIKKNAHALANNYQDQIVGNLAQRKDAGQNFQAAFGSNGQFDKAKTTQIVKKLMQQHPETFTDGKGDPVQVNDVVSAIGGVFGAIRGGYIAYDALKKFGWVGGPAAGNIGTKLYNMGAMHVVGGIFSAVELAVSADGQKVSGVNATSVATDISGGMAVTGFGLVAAGKFYTTTTDIKQAQSDLLEQNGNLNRANEDYSLFEAQAHKQKVEYEKAKAYYLTLEKNRNAPVVNVQRAQQAMDQAKAARDQAVDKLKKARVRLDDAGRARDLVQKKIDILKKGGTGLANSRASIADTLKESYKPDTFGKAAVDLGTGLFGASFVISGGLGIDAGVQALESGNKLAAGLNLTAGGLDVLSGVGYLGEAGLSAAAASGADVSVGALAAVEAATGPLAGLALVTGAALGIYGLVEYNIKVDDELSHTTKMVSSTLNQYGITGYS